MVAVYFSVNLSELDAFKQLAQLTPLQALLVECSLHDSSHLLLKLGNSINLLRARTALIKDIPQPLLGQPPGQLDSDDPLAHAQDLGVVAQHGPLDAEAVVRGDGADALDLVGGDGDAQPRAADNEGAVGLAFGDELGGGGGAVRVGRLVGRLVAADVDDLGDARVGLEVGLDLVLVGYACVLLGVGSGKVSLS